MTDLQGKKVSNILLVASRNKRTPLSTSTALSANDQLYSLMSCSNRTIDESLSGLTVNEYG